MPENDKKQSDNKAESKAESTDVGKDEVQQAFDEANEKGYFGETTDPTPDENYTIAGVVKGAPTPETDEKAAAKAREARNG